MFKLCILINISIQNDIYNDFPHSLICLPGLEVIRSEVMFRILLILFILISAVLYIVHLLCTVCIFHAQNTQVWQKLKCNMKTQHPVRNTASHIAMQKTSIFYYLIGLPNSQDIFIENWIKMQNNCFKLNMIIVHNLLY